MTREQLEALGKTTFNELEKEIKNPKDLAMIGLFIMESMLMIGLYTPIWKHIPFVLRTLANAMDVILTENKIK